MVTVIPQTGSSAGRRCRRGGRGRRRRGCASPARHNLGQDADRDLLRRHGAEVEPGRRLELPEPLLGEGAGPERLQHGAGARGARDQAHVVRAAPERGLERVLVEPAVRRHDDRRPRRHRDGAEVAHHTGIPELRLVRQLRLDDRHREARDGRQAGEGLDHGPAAHEDQGGLRQDGLHEDLESPAAVTGHRVLPHALRAAGERAALADEHQKARLAILERAERFLDRDRLRAAPADPARDRPVPPDQRLRAGLGRGRPLAADDRGDGERFAPSRERLGLGQPVRHAALLPLLSIVRPGRPRARRRPPAPRDVLSQSRRDRGGASRPWPA